uniref:Uncharacterized protein n=1 Tax=Tanacetum cinerariifolium TaxID=118510 RepID=A0A699RUM3_TANCI|nr:hypothetical protein [Tanacetum cinerariifolium]
MELEPKREYDLLWAVITRIAKRMGLLSKEVMNSLSASIYCRALDTITLRELIGPDGRYVGMFEHIAGHYGFTLQGEYAPPGYDEEQQDDEE